MSEYMNDYDRIEFLKQWWDKHGTAMIVGVVLGLIIVFGWQGWQRHQAKQHLAAAQAYQQLLMISVHEHPNEFAKQAETVISLYPNSSYASLSSLLLAHIYVDKEDYAAAYNSNMWVVNHTHDFRLKEIARIRAARLLLARAKPDDALNLLNTVDDPNFAVLADEVKGDIYVVKKDFPSARKAYQQALNDAPDSQVLLPALQLKLSSLPVTVAETLPATFNAKVTVTDEQQQ